MAHPSKPKIVTPTQGTAERRVSLGSALSQVSEDFVHRLYQPLYREAGPAESRKQTRKLYSVCVFFTLRPYVARTSKCCTYIHPYILAGKNGGVS